MLFVHGIGEQERGATVSLWCDAVAHWLRRWRKDDAVTVDAVHLVQDDDDPAAPAYADLTVTLTDPATGKPCTATWRCAESWWARSFQPPPFRELAVWGFGVVPYAVIAHFVARFERVWAAAGTGHGRWALRIPAVLLSMLEVAVAVVLAPILAVLVLAVLLLGAIPVTRLRQAAAALQRTLSRTVGDSFILLGSATRAGAIVHRIEHDLRWLDASCDNLVVVAHSQGAAVAHRAVRLVGPSGLFRFVTLGSGQTKLAQLDAVRRSGAQRAVWFAPAGAVLVVSSVLAVLDALGDPQVEDPWMYLIGAVYGLVLLIYGATTARTLRTPDDADLNPGATAGWLDIYASHDPVSNGPVHGIRPGHAIVTPRQVSNLASLTRDHTTYARNVEQVVTTLVDECATASGRAVDLDIVDDAVRQVAWARRSWRVGWLRTLRLVAFGVGAALIVLSADRLPALGRTALSAAASALNVVPLVDVDVAALDTAQLSPGVGAAFVVLAVAAAYAVVAGVWRLWDNADARRMFARDGYPLWAAEFVTLVWVVLALLAIAVLVVTRTEIRVDTDELLTPAMLLSPVAIAVILVVIAKILAPLVWLLKHLGAIRPAHYGPRAGELAAVLVPGEVLALAGAVTAGERMTLELILALMVAFGVPALALLLPALLSSSARVRRLLRPLRAWAYAEPLPLAAAPLVGDRAADVRAVYALILAGRIERVGKAGRERRLDDLAVEAVQVAAVMRDAGQTEEAVALLAAAAPASADAALALYDLRPTWPGLIDHLRKHAASGPWSQRRRVAAVLRKEAPADAL